MTARCEKGRVRGPYRRSNGRRMGGAAWGTPITGRDRIESTEMSTPFVARIDLVSPQGL